MSNNVESASNTLNTRDEIIIPTPECVKFDFVHYELGRPTKIWAYHNENGQIIGYIARWDTKYGKTIRPVCYTKANWKCCGFPKPWRLYNLHLICKYKDLSIMICEGEKAADAASNLFKNIIATTPMHGALSINETDWVPLAKRNVIICPDIDDVGTIFQKNIKKKCELAGATSIRSLDLKQIQKELNGEKIKGFDLADAYEMDWQPLNLENLLSDTPFDPQDVLPKGFIIKNWNIYYQRDKQNEVEEVFLCSYLVVKCRTRDLEGCNWGYLLEIRDADHKIKELAIPAEMLAGDGVELRELLLRNGVNIESGKNKILHQYLVRSNPTKHIRCASQTGWLNKVYILPEKIYKYKNEEEIRLQRRNTISLSYHLKGNLSTWQEKIGKYAAGNVNMIFVISLALAAPLIHLVNMENIAIHLVGPSSIGKTILLNIASSVWGNSIHNWRTTDNAFEAIAEMTNDGLLLFDELGQVDALAADQLSYMLGNGRGKLRSKRSGDVRDIKCFRLALLSSGENGLSNKLQEIGRKVKAGQNVRLVEVQANRKHGVFDNLHEFKDGDKFARYLKNACISNRGTLIDSFLEELVENRQLIVDKIQKYRKTWEEKVRANYLNADGQVQRVISKFSLIAACGEVATHLKLLHWNDCEASDACMHLLKNWINSRGGIISQEILEAAKTLQEFIEEHGNSRFENPWNDDSRMIHNRVGFKRLEESFEECGNRENIWSYYLLPSSFSKIISTANRSDVCNFFKSKGILEEDHEGKNAKSVRIPGFGTKRVYQINYSKLELFK